MHIPVTATLTALCGLLLLLLSMHISRLRFKHKVSLGDGGVSPLLRAIRLHGNTTEHVPIYLLLSLAYELSVGSDTLLLVTGIAFFAARLVFSWGLLTKVFTRQRQLGAMLTYLTQLTLVVALLWHSAHRWA